MDEQLFHYLYGALFLTFLVGQTVNVTRAAHRGGRYQYREKHLVATEAFRKGIGLPWFLAILCFVFKPAWVDWAGFALPLWLRSTGLALGLLGLGGVWWTELILGANFNTALHLRDAHTLVTSGPHHYIRHPMYTAIAVFGLGMFVLAPANWLIMVPGVAAFLGLMALRVKHEEDVMLERFGEAYRAYMERTGRFLPRFRA
jgi:protein-S-isoprenylcysteine O-methyltransferase Ste14